MTPMLLAGQDTGLSSKSEADIVDELSKFFLDVAMHPKVPDAPEGFSSVDSFRTLLDMLTCLRSFLWAASQGDISKKVECGGYVGGSLKTLQANLKHLTWQTKMVASGDFSQRVDFMGEFSDSFNKMVAQLDETLKELVRSESDLTKTNQELLKEIGIRKETEAALLEGKEALRRLAITDALTGLYNRGHFNDLATAEIGRALRYGRPLSVVMFDIDFFKRINDTFGHSNGDRVLKKVAAVAQETIRDDDILARYGGEEFIILLPETALADAAGTAERIRKRLEETTIHTETCEVGITASFGVSELPESKNSKPKESILLEVVNDADSALYEAKRAGKNRVTMHRHTTNNNIPPCRQASAG
jgi:diguanylate cyclase (GGDEF)-like protein